MHSQPHLMLVEVHGAVRVCMCTSTSAGPIKLSQLHCEVDGTASMGLTYGFLKLFCDGAQKSALQYTKGAAHGKGNGYTPCCRRRRLVSAR